MAQSRWQQFVSLPAPSAARSQPDHKPQTSPTARGRQPEASSTQQHPATPRNSLPQALVAVHGVAHRTQQLRTCPEPDQTAQSPRARVPPLAVGLRPSASRERARRVFPRLLTLQTFPVIPTKSAKINSSTSTAAGPALPTGPPGLPPPVRQAAVPVPPSPSAHTSPPLTAQPSPSTLQASPHVTPRHVAASVPGVPGIHVNGDSRGRKTGGEPRMRSQIACAKCRRSKIKCENNGPNTTCTNCKNSNRECLYPATGPSISTSTTVTVTSSSNTLPRRESVPSNPAAPGDRPNADAPRKRKRTIAPTSTTPYRAKDSPGAVDPFDPQVLTQEVWTQLIEIFDQHFATELPFLHATRFLRSFKQTKSQSYPEDSPSERSSPPVETADDPFLIAFLALTAPFHGKLVQHLTPTNAEHADDPTVASEIYAELARDRLKRRAESKNLLQETQALLMLGYYEWRMNHGVDAFRTITDAITLAKVQGLHIEPDLDDKREACELTIPSEEPAYTSREDQFITQEIRRRTFWSCFIMDRYLSCGKYRHQSLQLSDIRTQLPCSERAFSFGQNVKTMMLDEKEVDFLRRKKKLELGASTQDLGMGDDMRDDDDIKFEYGDNEDTLARFIRALELFGDILRNWSCLGGRQLEKETPPWHQDSTFRKYEEELARLKRSLPSELRLSPSRTEAHIRLQTSRNYVQLHAIFTLCSIALHREYMPFLPFRCKRPEGPLDPPTFHHLIPPVERGGMDYWDNAARECFRSARDFHDLLRTCQEGGVLVETPVTTFAAYHVVVCVLYCQFFQKMDTGQYLHKTNDKSFLEREREQALNMMRHFSVRSKMAVDELKTLQKLWDYLRDKTEEYLKLPDSPDSNRSSGSTASANPQQEYSKIFERDLKEFNHIRGSANGRFASKDSLRPVSVRQKPEDLSVSGSPSGVKSEAADKMEGVQHPQRFTAVNSTPNGTPIIPNGMSNHYMPGGDRLPHSNPTSPQEGRSDQYLSPAHTHQPIGSYPTPEGSMHMNNGGPYQSLPYDHNHIYPQTAAAQREEAISTFAQIAFTNHDFANWSQGNDFSNTVENASRAQGTQPYSHFHQIHNHAPYGGQMNQITDYPMHHSAFMTKYD